MRIRNFVAPLLIAAGGAAAIAIAPLAQAESTPTPCTFTGNASVCQTEATRDSCSTTVAGKPDSKIRPSMLKFVRLRMMLRMGEALRSRCH